MALTLQKHFVTAVSLGADPRGIENGRLTVDGEALAVDLQAQDRRLENVRVSLALPGESTRILCVKDVIQPRLTMAQTNNNSNGTSATVCVVENVAVVTCGPIVGFQEGIIDMSGPGAAHTPFSAMPLIVLQIDANEALDPHEHEAAVREAGMAAADFVARSCVDARPGQIESLQWEDIPAGSELPRIAYVYMVLSQGLLHDTYVLGQNAKYGLPVTIDPRIVFETAVQSGNCVSACDKNTTYHHQNNPIIAELLRGHGSRWNFVGIVITNEPVRLGDKQRSATSAVELMREMNPAGAIISKEGFGNPDADLMMIVRGLEQAGIKSVAITDEYAGVDGGSQSLADTAAEADAIISVGNSNERIELPAMRNTIGPVPDAQRLAGGYPHSLHADGSMEVELQAITGSTNQLGFGQLSCREV
jgi:glycine reductase